MQRGQFKAGPPRPQGHSGRGGCKKKRKDFGEYSLFVGFLAAGYGAEVAFLLAGQLVTLGDAFFEDLFSLGAG